MHSHRLWSLFIWRLRVANALWRQRGPFKIRTVFFVLRSLWDINPTWFWIGFINNQAVGKISFTNKRALSAILPAKSHNRTSPLSADQACGHTFQWPQSLRKLRRRKTERIPAGWLLHRRDGH